MSSEPTIAKVPGKSGMDGLGIQGNTNQALVNWENLVTDFDGSNAPSAIHIQHASDLESMERAIGILQKQRQTLNQRAEEIFSEVMDLYKYGVLLELFQEDHTFLHQLAATKQHFQCLT
ncbi:uncharacterized protein BO87DRAFT_414762 [Aspergillus neoniger CBS 115656]|uniref:Uncharacterized protein n=1 Tax=Aspergillus neoniger (strain CBS 115656) TaxID=1448310 RepID=A0A318YUF1_ASPNB|nr:hypothetical protein BO87DRAFT_414762 [Aspergillus neoniger CBS 115656]PYH35600.1 hypothetical protein BO87DRAFT_414762 [Aspergillus neoniger CBS 115656]